MTFLPPVARAGTLRRAVAVILMVALLAAALASFILADREAIKHLEPVASRATETPVGENWHHAPQRNELLIFRTPTLEVYRIDSALTHLRSVPIKLSQQRLRLEAVFPKSPRAIVRAGEQMVIVDTVTGDVERTLSDWVGGLALVVSPDERWLALSWPDVRTDTGGIQRGRYPLLVYDLQSGRFAELGPRGSDREGPVLLNFASPTVLVAIFQHAGRLELWDLSVSKLLASATRPQESDTINSVAASRDVIVAAAGNMCEIWDAKRLAPLRSHEADRPVTAVAIHPDTGDYLAGYSSLNFTVRSRLSGAVRVWDPSGRCLATFAAHRTGNWCEVTWMCVSDSGEFLVTANTESLKLWKFPDLLH